jgi:hypothetical protein
MGTSLKKFREERAELARLAREAADKKKQAPVPADAPAAKETRPNPYTRLITKVRADIAARNQDQKAG